MSKITIYSDRSGYLEWDTYKEQKSLKDDLQTELDRLKYLRGSQQVASSRVIDDVINVLEKVLSKQL